MSASTGNTLPLCHKGDIADGMARGFLPTANARRKIIVLNRNGRYLAWLDSCPHYSGGTPMAWRADSYLSADGQFLSCHSHGALFDIETGVCIAGPCIGQKLTRVPLELESDGTIRIDSIAA